MTNSRLLHYESRRPILQLQPWVLEYSRFWFDPSGTSPIPHSVPPDSCVNITVMITEPESDPVGVILGPRTRPFTPTVLPGSNYWSVRIWPAMASSLRGLESIPAAQLTDERLPLESVNPTLFSMFSLGLSGGPELRSIASHLD